MGEPRKGATMHQPRDPFPGPSANGHASPTGQPVGMRQRLEQLARWLRAAGFWAYLTPGASNEWLVACDTAEGHLDVRLSDEGVVVEAWDTSPGLFWDIEDERRRAVLERMARMTLPRLAHALLGPDADAWWDEADHGVGLRLRLVLPEPLAEHALASAARDLLNELGRDLAWLEQRLLE